MLGGGRVVTGAEGEGCSLKPRSTHSTAGATQEPEEAWGRFLPGASGRNQPYLGFELLASRTEKLMWVLF